MIDDKLIEEIAKQAKPKYQQDYSNFKPGEDYVMYSGQMWDEKEFAAGLKSFLTGKCFFTADIITRLADEPEFTMCDCFTPYFFENLI